MPGLTKEQIESVITDVRYTKLGTKTSVCILTLKNGFEVCATSACVHAEDYDSAVGNQIAYQRALDKVWELEGYVAQWQRYWNGPSETTTTTEEAQPAAA